MQLRKLLFIVLISSSNLLYSQESYQDAAQAFNKLVSEKRDDKPIRINNYRVYGSPYYLGQQHLGNLYTNGGTIQNIYLSYNTYKQEIEYADNPDQQPMLKEVALIDSFIIKPDLSLKADEEIRFINNKFLSQEPNGFSLEMYAGSKFTLYKRYKSELRQQTDNYSQPDVQVLELIGEYYYYNHNTKQLKRLKTNFHSIQKEFKNILNITSVIKYEQFNRNTDRSLKQLFKALNK